MSQILTNHFKYDVFLSFRGEDTRYNFTGNLYHAFRRSGINTYLDDQDLRVGDEISPSLLKAIEESRISVIVFSKKYASSTWCLDELVKILECKKQNNQLVWPIFYKVDPSDLRHQRNSYGRAMIAHEMKFGKNSKRVLNWRSALTKVANFKGDHFRITGQEYESEFIDKIVKKASTKLPAKGLLADEHVVGLESRLEELKSLLNISSHSRAVCMLGIYGIGGMGKSTLAKTFYNSIAHQFEYKWFLVDVKDAAKQYNGLVNLQEKLLSKMFEVGDIKLDSVEEGAFIIKNRLHNKRVLLVLDDVDSKEQLDMLARDCNWFGSGSRIIITTRNKHLLLTHGVEKTYKMNELNDREAFELFCWKAFKTNQPLEKFVDLSNEVVNYAGGLPLALKVIGSNLFGKNLDECRCALNQYKKIPDNDIQSILRISYDGLQGHQKDVFLDIACFLKGCSLKDVKTILEACDLGADYNIGVLINKSLITIDEFHQVRMHGLIQDMGREVVREFAPEDLGKRSRLWFHEDIVRVLEDNSGTNSIQGIMLDSPPQEIQWKGKAFKKMKNLRILIVRNAYFSTGPKYLPRNLRVLEWEGYPLNSLPSSFDPKKLVVLKMPNSCLKLGKPFKKFECVSIMDFSCCQFITRVPDMSGVPILKELSLSNCKNLVKVHDSIGFLTRVTYLNFECCTNLTSLPSALKMTSLRRLNIKDCTSLQRFPDLLGKMDCLREIDATNTAIEELPDSVSNLPRCVELQLSGCNIVSIPRCIKQLSHLGILFVINFKKLQQISKIVSNFNLDTRACTSLTLRSSIVLWSQANLELSSIILTITPATRIPEWYDHRCEGAVLSFWIRNNFPVASFEFINSTYMEKDTKSAVKLQLFINGVEVFDMVISGSYAYKCHSYFLHLGTPISMILETYLVDDWNFVQFKVAEELPISSHDIVIKECGVFVFKTERNMEDIWFECPIPTKSTRHEPRDIMGNLQDLRTEKRYEFESESSNNIAMETSAILYITEHAVGLEPRIKEVISLLDIPSNRTVCMLGIYGIGGIGKTTLVKALYNSIFHQFDSACFLFDVRETSNRGTGLVHLQKTMLSMMPELENVELGSVDEGSYVIKSRLCHRRVLLVLDDVDCEEQLEKLAGECNWFGSGSRIIITTRNKHLLLAHGVEKTYQMKKLNDHEALKLFCWAAFRSSQPPERFVDLSNEIVTYAKGLPLALRVIGSNLVAKDLDEWECALSQYKRIPDISVQRILRVSYDGLELVQKDIFLDIAFFFKGYRLRDIMDAHVFVLKAHILVLIDKSLITVDEFGHVQMHDLIQAMGQEVVRRAAAREPGRRSRLCHCEDVIEVLEEKLGTSQLQGIMLDSPKKEILWTGTALRKMKNLRILIVQNGRFSIGPKYLPNNLRFLEWNGYPSTSLPPNFDPKNLVVLNMAHSCLKLEKLSKEFTCVRVMNFSYCQFITEVPDMSGVKNLTKLNLSYCKNLVKVHESVGFLTKVTFLSFECCTNLASLPTSLQMTSLERLNIKDCTSLQCFPDILVNMDRLKEIDATNTAIKELPDSISNLKRFLELQLSGYNIVSIPRYIKQLSHLGILFVINWKKLQQISEIPSDFNLHAKACTSLTLKSSIVLWSQANLELSRIILIIKPAAKIPEYYDHRCEGAVLSFWVRKRFPVGAFAFINSTYMEKDTMSAVKLQLFINGIEVNFDMVISGSYGYKCHSYFLHFGTPILKVLETYLVDEWNYVEFKVTDYLQMSSNDIVIKECGVFMLKTERNMEDVRFQCPNPPMSSRMVPRHALKRGATLDPGCEPPKNTQEKTHACR